MCMPSGGQRSPNALPAVATEQDPAVQAALDADRKRRAAAGGMSSTMLTGGAGLTAPATTAPKTLLGA